MTRLALLAAVLLAATACGRKGARSSDFDSAAAAATGPAEAAAAALPKVGHIAGVDFAHALDRNSAPFGGTSDRFDPADDVAVSIRTAYVTAGATVGVKITNGKHTIDSTMIKTTAADSTGTGIVGYLFHPASKWAPGEYNAEITLDGKFQVSRPFTIAGH